MSWCIYIPIFMKIWDKIFFESKNTKGVSLQIFLGPPKKKIFILQKLWMMTNWWNKVTLFFYILINLKVIVKNLNKKITQPQITRIDLHHLFQHDPCKKQVQIPKFHSNRTSGSWDIAISFFLPDLVSNIDTRCLWTNSKSLLDLIGPKTRNIHWSNTRPSRIMDFL